MNEQVGTLKQQLQQQEKLASLGMLSAGIAHEIQNPLNFVINFSKMSTKLLDDLSDIVNDNADKHVRATGLLQAAPSSSSFFSFFS